jgi:hypothetical protein
MVILTVVLIGLYHFFSRLSGFFMVSKNARTNWSFPSL